ncbi:hypothetical protein QR680_011168 [Steinernema hermaphroditum]|uniref:Uncharacterized protein n=1 Tax=Steinernema hermaphroditum TaxID=289476 RepID=A0AA39IRC0_9BILA|nr:hypothetical protein QR680_011168 [Steinernema hermaphroditum]
MSSTSKRKESKMEGYCRRFEEGVRLQMPLTNGLETNAKDNHTSSYHSRLHPLARHSTTRAPEKACGSPKSAKHYDEPVLPFHFFRAALANARGEACRVAATILTYGSLAVNICCAKSALTVLANAASSYVKDAADAIVTKWSEGRDQRSRYSPVVTQV